MSDSQNDLTNTPVGQERSSFTEQWAQRQATTEPRADNSPERNVLESERPAQFSAWNWVIIAVMIISLGWYIAKLPATLGLH